MTDVSHDFASLLRELEAQGSENDARALNKAEKYLNITRDTGEFLAVLVQACKAQHILEIGTSNGYSTLWLASALPSNGKVTTIECDARKLDAARINFERAGLKEFIVQLEGDVAACLPTLQQTYDFIFLDADRSQYLPLAEQIFALLAQGGLLVCDNAVSHRDELQLFIAWIEKQPDLTVSLVPVGKGELLVHKASV
ncbi:O-methyltransferase [Cardiobacteriaceae bacterium TAE3-ERU3]|nr:O-methyltransferase [Cardiobacteriaceae bacterium TAE3-ERU3]